MFHRVVAIHCRGTDNADADMDGHIIQQFKQLEEITFTLPTQKSTNETVKAKLKSTVPSCRVASTIEEKGALRIKTTHGAFAVSCSD